VLLGRTPADLENVLGSTGQIPNPPQNVAAGIPSDLLRRRPDVHVAERELATQSAKIGISEAEFYPHISLIGQIGLQSQDMSRLFQTDSLIGAVGPGVRWNLLNYGRIKNKWIADKEAFQRLVYSYHGSVLKAYQEVEDSQVAYLRGFDRVAAIERTVLESSEAARIGYDTFVEGGIDFGRVLILQTDLVRAEDELLAARSDVALSLVKLFLSLGGGWAPNDCHNVQMASHQMVRH
jgi:outer membrane protein TolC